MVTFKQAQHELNDTFKGIVALQYETSAAFYFKHYGPLQIDLLMIDKLTGRTYWKVDPSDEWQYDFTL